MKFRTSLPSSPGKPTENPNVGKNLSSRPSGWWKYRSKRARSSPHPPPSYECPNIRTHTLREQEPDSDKWRYLATRKLAFEAATASPQAWGCRVRLIDDQIGREIRNKFGTFDVTATALLRQSRKAISSPWYTGHRGTQTSPVPWHILYQERRLKLCSSIPPPWQIPACDGRCNTNEDARQLGRRGPFRNHSRL
jgi:hypothetical protein